MGRLPLLLLGTVLMLGSAAAPAATRLLTGRAPATSVAPDPAAAEATAAAVAESDAQTAALVQQRDTLRAEAATAPQRVADFESELAEPVADAVAQWIRRLPQNADGDTLEALLEQERLALAELRSQQQTLTTELTQALAGPASGRTTAADRLRRLEQLRAPPVEGAAVDENQRLRDAAETRRLQAEQDLDDTRNELAGGRQRLLELELRVVRHRLAVRGPRESVLQRMITAWTRQRLNLLVTGLEAEATRAAAGDDPLVARTESENVELGREMVTINEALADDRRELVVQRDALDRDLTAMANGRTRLNLDSTSEQVGIWLWAELRRLEPERRVRQQLAEVRNALAASRLRLIGIDEMQRDLADPAVAAREMRFEQSSPNDDDGDQAPAAGRRDRLQEALARQRTLADDLEPMLWRRVATLEETERSLQARFDANRDLRLLMARHLLWIRSHAPVDAAWLATLDDGLRDQFKWSRFVITMQLVREDFAANPARYIASVALIVLLVLVRRRAPAELDVLGQMVRDVREDSYLRTLRCLGWTTLAALPVPMALLLLGGLLRGVGTSGKYSDSVGFALLLVSLLAMAFFFLHWLLRERGLAHAHFRWTRQRREALRWVLPRLGPVLAVLYFLFILAFARNQDLAASVQGRICVVLAMLVWAFGFFRLLAPERLLHTRGFVEPSRMRQGLRIVLTAGCVAAAWLGLEGHVWSAVALARSVAVSVIAFVGIAVVHGMLSRWFVLGARRLAMKRWLEKRAEENADAGGDAGGDTVPVEVQEEITLEKVDANSRALLRVVRWTLLAFAMVVIWGQFVLALVRFDEVPLWTVSAVADDGSAIREQITLLSVIAGVLVLWLTVVAARNLPGLIEIGLQSRGGVDAASRYAVTSVSRYAIVVIGFVIGFGLFGLRWSQLQWMAAALTLGLSFGLQEIFANFVSGLILLFERPFRVGDTVTVNNLDGVVTRIRTRATTILDFDNKEIVVPNKAFITGQLINWTLTDETTRVTIRMGVDYGADPALVHRLLLQAANENDKVMKDWPPRTWLMNFGANSLDFELRFFVASMNDRLPARNEVSTRIIELFEANGIGFPYPQLDVHVRNMPASPAGTPPASPAGTPPAPSSGPPSGGNEERGTRNE